MDKERPNPVLIALRGIVLINGLLFALSFIPWWHGSANGLEWLASLFDAYRWNGFSSVFVWQAATTLLLFLALFFFLFECLIEGRDAWRARFLDMGLYLVSGIAFVIYVVKEMSR